MPTVNRSGTLFVGIDVHKDTHTAVGLTPFGERVFEMQIGNEAEDFISLIENSTDHFFLSSYRHALFEFLS